MRVTDPGHQFALQVFDGRQGEEQFLVFVKRDTPLSKYPGNVGRYPGTNLQEVLRACLSRLDYVDAQDNGNENMAARAYLRNALYQLELRAHRKHGKILGRSLTEVLTAEPCRTCGHVFCTWCVK